VIQHDELERIWKETVIVYFKILSPHLTTETKENHEKPQSGNWSQSQNSNSQPYKYETVPLDHNI
jgi:hypothetical protein